MSHEPIMVCVAKCDGCQWGEHPGRKHSWADEDEIKWARENGHPDPSKQLCGCRCQRAYRPVPKRRQLLHNGGKP
jgi:hypothetical protein